MFVDQVNYDNIMEGVFGEVWMTDARDREVLAIIDELPSLDPFLLREHLKRHQHQPARCYFEISDADVHRMYRFVEHEIHKLVALCYQGAPGGSERGRGSRLVKKILSDAVDAETEPLRLTLKLERCEYEEGVFCWKGFLYYKWTLAEALPSVSQVAEAIAKAKARGGMDLDTKIHLEKTRGSLRASIQATLESARTSLRVYDAAFASLIDGKPQAFRDFLLSAPAMFCELGERLGAVGLIVSYWNFRFPRGKAPELSGQELADIFADFERSLAFQSSHPSTGLGFNVAAEDEPEAGQLVA